MKILLSSIAIGCVMIADVAAAACEKPDLPNVPDGATATEDELLAVQVQVEIYVAAMDRYIACENEAMEAGSDQTTAEFIILMSERIESAKDEVDVVATRFNAQVEAFRAARQPQGFVIQ